MIKKIFISKKPVSGPWGGGNKFVNGLINTCVNNNIEVVFDLSSSNIDVIFCFDPRPNSLGLSYYDYQNYKKKNSHTKIVQRVGDIGTHSKPDLFKLVNKTSRISDFVIFPSEWSRKMLSYEKNNFIIVPNAPDEIFYKNRSKNYKINKKSINIITHHWSDNPKKGFDVYSLLGQMIVEKKLNASFTYVGRYNNAFSSKGIKIIEPQDKESLAKLLPENDIYLTASLEEAGANHVLEALACGLPILYRKDGGSIEEYCEPYGISYDHNLNALLQGLEKIVDNFENIKDSCLKYQNTLDSCVLKYWEIICKI